MPVPHDEMDDMLERHENEIAELKRQIADLASTAPLNAIARFNLAAQNLILRVGNDEAALDRVTALMNSITEEGTN